MHELEEKTDKEELVHKMCDLILAIADELEKEDCKNTDLLNYIAKQNGLSKTQLFLLRQITLVSRKKAISVNDLARLVNKTPSALIPHLNELEDKGFVKRTRKRFDRRKVYLVVTPKGENVVENLIEQETDPWFFDYLLEMPSEEIEKMVEKLQGIALMLKKKKPEPKHVPECWRQIRS